VTYEHLPATADLTMAAAASASDRPSVALLERNGRHGSAPTPIRGRDEQLSRIDASLAALAGGQGGVVLVTGAAGMGKTALLTRAREMASARRIRVFDSAGELATQAVPLAPILDAIVVDDPPVDRGRLRQLSLSVDLRFWLLRELEEELARAAAWEPMVIAIDDLQWADAVTFLFLKLRSRQVAPTGILWLLSFRPGDLDLAASLTVDLLKAAGAVTLTLDRLDEEAVVDIAADALGGVPDDALARALGDVGGHPFWLTELLLGMRDDRLVTLDAGVCRLLTSRIPREFARSVLRRLDLVPDETRHLLELAAVLGDRFSFDELAGMSGRPPGDLLGPLRRALAADWLIEEGGQLIFRHRLVRKVIDQQLTEAVRQDARRRAPRPVSPGNATWARQPQRQPEPEPEWPELSAAESAVARLAARGESNRRIAGELFLSPHTIDSHLRRIFAKLGVCSRVELARLAAERR
jgi:DNA-binding CsgD family transcriptional regulator/predicted ATPase